MEMAHTRRQNGYRALFAPSAAPQSGMALLVSNRLAEAQIERVHHDASGHTLIATVHLRDAIELMVVVSHAPPHSSDATRTSYFNTLANSIPPRDARHPDRVHMWMGDFNFEERRPTGEIWSASERSARGQMLTAYAEVCKRLGSASGGLEDAWVIAHPEDPHCPTSKAGRAIDRILIDPKLLGGTPGLLDADCLHARLLQVPSRTGALRAAPDHAAPRITLRLSDVKRPDVRPTYTPKALNDERHAEVAAAIKESVTDPHTSPADALNAVVVIPHKATSGHP